MIDPILLLAQWLDDAGGAGSIEAIAMCLATADGRGEPSARIVLLRGLDERGLRFFTSYLSRKGRELAQNPRAAAVLYWPQLHRQARVEGEVAMLGEDESDAYFSSRPRGHRLAAWSSEQSEPLESYAVLEERFAHFDARFEGEEVPRPHSWGGYLLAPSRIEFWQGRPNRMHERMLYTRSGNLWEMTRLQP
ncbi:MAG: pyridoxamine 5'-phosphate oxidase [Candidatus Eremiobacteraeota bacterium]|nr:pyridoxamine 5'-phosphate oxidase [Candidatus Eremiobacteraeota bacterium]